MSNLTAYQADPAFKIVTGVCPHDCPDTCAWQVAVDASCGVATDIWGHADHPVTAGTLCGKVDRRCGGSRLLNLICLLELRVASQIASDGI